MSKVCLILVTVFCLSACATVSPRVGASNDSASGKIVLAAPF